LYIIIIIIIFLTKYGGNFFAGVKGMAIFSMNLCYQKEAHEENEIKEEI
jgi:hypothetical protein